MKWGLIIVFTIGMLSLVGCSSVPKEVVELSYQMGQDITALHASYDELIQERYNDHRQRRRDYLENKWKPKFLKKVIKDGRLIDVAKGEVIWSFERKEFVPPNPKRKETEILTYVDAWTKHAISEIQRKEKILIDPLDKQEKKLRKEVRDAFDRVIKGNAHVTAHLNSIRKVQAVEDEVLEALKLKELRDKITQTMAELSQKANESLEKVKKVDGFIDKSIEFIGDKKDE